MAGEKLRATLQVDVDGLGVLLRHHGLQTAAHERDFIFLSGLPRFLDLFARWDVKATFFVVGTDLQVPDKLKVLERLVDEGHEIGNHTASHPLSLSSLSVEEQREEIGCCDALCQKLLGVKPVGFRAPNFDVGEDTAAILGEMGYLYDSSVLAMPYGPLLRWCKDRVSTKVATKTRYLGCAAFGLASLHPYPLGARSLWMRGDSKLVEVPVTTMPFLRLPFHASFNLALNSLGMGNSLFNIGYACTWRTKTPLNYVFHVCELAQLGDDRRLDKHWGLTLPVEQRVRVADRLIEKIKSKYQVMTTKSYVQQMQGGVLCPV